MKIRKFAAATLFFGAVASQSVQALGVKIMHAELYKGPLVTLPATTHWRSETLCLREAVRTYGTTCLKVPPFGQRAGQWVLVSKGRVLEIHRMWRSVGEWRSQCEARPSYQGVQSSIEWRFEPATRQCVHVWRDKRGRGESWL